MSGAAEELVTRIRDIEADAAKASKVKTKPITVRMNMELYATILTLAEMSKCSINRMCADMVVAGVDAVRDELSPPELHKMELIAAKCVKDIEAKLGAKTK